MWGIVVGILVFYPQVVHRTVDIVAVDIVAVVVVDDAVVVDLVDIVVVDVEGVVESTVN